MEVLAAHAPSCVMQNNLYNSANKSSDMNVHANGIQHF